MTNAQAMMRDVIHNPARASDHEISLWLAYQGEITEKWPALSEALFAVLCVEINRRDEQPALMVPTKAKRHRWTKEQLDYLEFLIEQGMCDIRALCRAVNEQFRLSVTVGAVKGQLKNYFTKGDLIVGKRIK